MAEPLGENGVKTLSAPFDVYLPQSVDGGEAARLHDLLIPFGARVTRDLPQQPYFLSFDDGKIVLRAHEGKEKVYADFVSGSLAYRARRNRGELIARAVNVREYHDIWDATAGLGKDAFVLAALGARVTLFERHPLAAILLADALARAAAHQDTAAIAARMSLVFGSLTDRLERAVSPPQVVYLDPMFPERHKSALVKKEMRFFQAVVGADEDSAALLHAARRLASRRIVVKRPRHGGFVGEAAPDYQYLGKSTRFDVYLPLSLYTGARRRI